MKTEHSTCYVSPEAYVIVIEPLRIMVGSPEQTGTQDYGFGNLDEQP
jgi:hypothetical protein